MLGKKKQAKFYQNFKTQHNTEIISNKRFLKKKRVRNEKVTQKWSRISLTQTTENLGTQLHRSYLTFAPK